MTGLVWLAVDGLGHPADAPPGSVWAQDLPALRPLVDAGLALDATLGVPGLPQSGTGQACWLTGTDAVRLMGEHFGPQPGPTLQRLLRAQALPVRLARAGARLALANEYAPGYGDPLGGGPPGSGGRNRLGCFPYAFTAAGLPLNPPGVTPARATLGREFRAPWAARTGLDAAARLGEALARDAGEFDLLVLDLWFSDLLGHEGRPGVPPEALAAGRSWLARLDALLAGLLHAGARLVLSSDHGNLEDLSLKGHTLARVPFAGSGVNLGAPETVVDGGRVIAGWFDLPAPGATEP